MRVFLLLQIGSRRNGVADLDQRVRSGVLEI